MLFNLVSYKPSEMAAASMFLSMHLPLDTFIDPLFPLFGPAFASYCTTNSQLGVRGAFSQIEFHLLQISGQQITQDCITLRAEWSPH